MCEDCILNGRCSGCDDAGWYDYQRDEIEHDAWFDSEEFDDGLYL